MFACNGILFNHESPTRGETFVTRKITRAVARIALGLQEKVYLGNLDATRDWGHARDYAQAMWLMLQQEKAEDFVIATGKSTSVRELVEMAFREIGAELDFSGSGSEEKGVIKSVDSQYNLKAGQEVVSIDTMYYRPTEVDELVGDATKAKEKLGWAPTSTLNELVSEMVSSDLKLFQRDKYLKEGGHDILNYYE